MSYNLLTLLYTVNLAQSVIALAYFRNWTGIHKTKNRIDYNLFKYQSAQLYRLRRRQAALSVTSVRRAFN